MKIIKEKPPNYKEICEAFPSVLKTPTVVFCWGDIIYSPSTDELPEALHAHENVHSDRQLQFEGGPQKWWEKYLINKTFRFEEELLAHSIEYEYLALRSRSRKERRFFLRHISEKLASPIYGPMVSEDKAKQHIRKLIKEIKLEATK
jgi:hypothetical protein